MNYLTIFFKGIAMGAADVVPGVSGGTIAFITGIYDTLLESIYRINPSLLQIFKQRGAKAAFVHINGYFLISLLTGIVVSIAVFAGIITFLLTNYPIPVWSFFFGLILVSVYHIMRQVDKFNIQYILVLIIGLAFAYMITILKPLHLEPNLLNILLAGAIAICAMILPGISGSFILLLIGMYEPILDGVKLLQFDILGVFLFGCIIGLLSFSHLLSFLLKNYRNITLSFLTGLMIGTLPKIWPWKHTLTWRINSKGDNVPLEQLNLSPLEFERIAAEPSQLGLAIIMMLLAIGLVLALEQKVGKKS